MSAPVDSVGNRIWTVPSAGPFDRSARNDPTRAPGRPRPRPRRSRRPATAEGSAEAPGSSSAARFRASILTVAAARPAAGPGWGEVWGPGVAIFCVARAVAIFWVPAGVAIFCVPAGVAIFCVPAGVEIFCVPGRGRELLRAGRSLDRPAGGGRAQDPRPLGGDRDGLLAIGAGEASSRSLQVGEGLDGHGDLFSAGRTLDLHRFGPADGSSTRRRPGRRATPPAAATTAAANSAQARIAFRGVLGQRLEDGLREPSRERRPEVGQRGRGPGRVHHHDGRRARPLERPTPAEHLVQGDRERSTGRRGRRPPRP